MMRLRSLILKKKHLLMGSLLAVAGLSFSNCTMAQDSVFQLEADLSNFGDTLLIYRGRDAKTDTVLKKDGLFVYSATIKTPVGVILMSPGTFRHEERKLLRLVSVPGEKVILKGDVEGHYDITGTVFYEQYGAVNRMLEEADKPMDDLERSVQEQVEKGADKLTVMQQANQKAEQLEKEREEKLLAYIKQHGNEEASAVLINQFDSSEKMEKAVALLSESVKNGRMRYYYQPALKQVKAREAAEAKAAKIQASGVEAPDFTLKDIEGHDFTLSSLRGKYVILDFWGSWCIWCIKGMPQMKEYYQKYAGKFEIVGVDCNDTEAKWKAAVEKHQLPWKHVYNKRGGADDVCEKYAIQGFPTKIILSPEGKIVKTVVGEDPAFYSFLDELFGK